MILQRDMRTGRALVFFDAGQAEEGKQPRRWL
jgi:hypothetical protein